MKPEIISNEIQCPTIITPENMKEKPENKNKKSLVGRAVLRRVEEFLVLSCGLVICIIAFIPISLPFYIYCMVAGDVDHSSSLGSVNRNNKADDVPPESKTFGSKLKSFVKQTPTIVDRAIKHFGMHIVEAFFLPFILVSGRSIFTHTSHK